MQRFTKLVCLGIVTSSLFACELPTPSPPPMSLLAQGMAEALVDTGFYTEVAITRTIGHHYVPSERAWNVFACFQFVVPSGEQGTTCVDSFQALKLENGTWVVGVTIDGIYRWRAISIAGESQGSPGTASPSEPG